MTLTICRGIMLNLLLTGSIGLASTGCTALSGPVQYEQAARQRTVDMLTTVYRLCLAKGETEDICQRDLLAYRSCLDAGGNDAQCRIELSQ